jgi:hypothetical protein
MQPATYKPLKTSNSGSKFFLALLIVLLVAVGWLAINRRAVMDWISLRGYQPPALVSQLATQDTMTAYAQHVFYVNHPQVQLKAAFDGECPSGTEQTVVLGCYHSDQAGIYVLQVSDPQLSGVEQVTAAHETLHAIYDRLSTAKRNQVDGWLTDYYNSGLTDPNIKAQIASYKQTEPHDVVNEMHSLFGTEVGNLPPQLEQYYAQYFTNRAAVVADYNNYQAAFSTRLNAIKQDDSQLATIKAQINADNADLKNRDAAINGQQNTLDQEKSSGDVTAYNNGVPGYNAQIDAYNAEVQAVHQLVTQYNQLVSARNGLALEEQQLSQELSGNTVPSTK